MGTLYDIIASAVISGNLLVLLIGFNRNIVEQVTSQMMRSKSQSDLTTVTAIIECDFQKMGYLVARTDTSVLRADSNSIKFLGDVNDDGVIDTVTYSFDPIAASGFANTNTHILHRTVDSQPPQAINIGITRFRLQYYAAPNSPLTLNPITKPSKIKAFKLAVNIESTVPYKITQEQYVTKVPGTYWERLFKPTNL